MELFKRTINRLRTLLPVQRGLGLAETLVAVAILGTAVVAFVAAISSGSIAVGAQDEATRLQALARTQLEYTRSYTYIPGAAGYPTVAVPPGYGVSVTVSPVPGTDTDIQKITVDVSREGQVEFSVSEYKVNR